MVCGGLFEKSRANKNSSDLAVSIAFHKFWGYNNIQIPAKTAGLYMRKDGKLLLRLPDTIMPILDNEKTKTFSILDEKDREIKATLSAVYEALSEKGYNPIHQIVEYVLSEDPTYITNYKNARSLITRIDRYELMGALVRTYLGL